MTPQHHLPADIERTSMGLITAEPAARRLDIQHENAAVVKRVIHTTADFDYAENLRFTPGAAAAGVAAMRAGAVVITDTNMALAGITKPGLAKLGGQAHCFMADPAVAAAAKAAGSTRAAAAMHRAAREYPRRGTGRWQRPHGAADDCGRDRKRSAPRAGHRRARRLCERGGKQGTAVCGLHAVRRARHRRHGPQGRQQRGCRHLQRAGVFRRRDARPCGKRMAVIHFLPPVFPYNRKFGAVEACCLLRFLFVKSLHFVKAIPHNSRLTA